MLTSVELTSPLDNKRYKICYFCAKDLNEDQNFLECGHQFCKACTSALQTYPQLDSHNLNSSSNNNSSNSNNNTDNNSPPVAIDDNCQQLHRLFRAAQESAKASGLSGNHQQQLGITRKFSESQLANLLLRREQLSERNRQDSLNNDNNKNNDDNSSNNNNSNNSNDDKDNRQQYLIKCPVCRRTSLPSSFREDKKTAAGDLQSLSDLTPLEDRLILRCDCCVHKGRLGDEQTVEAEFFCQKCSLNFCHKCRAVHDETPLFREHPVLPVSGKISGGVERLCLRHNNLSCSYFCVTCKLPLCSLCVLFHNSNSNNNNSNNNNNINFNFAGVRSADRHGNSRTPVIQKPGQDFQSPQGIKMLLDQSRSRELGDYTILRSVVSDDTFQCSPVVEDASEHKIVKLREALTMVREELKSSLNHLGPQLDGMKEKLRCFFSPSAEDTPSPFPSACSSSSSSSTLSPPPVEAAAEQLAGLKKQQSIKKRHSSTGEKNVMARLLRPKSNEKDQPEQRFGRFRLSKAKKLSLGSNIPHSCSTPPTSSVKNELSSPNDVNSDGSDGNSWSSTSSTNHLKLFRNFRKKFQTGNPKNSPVSSEHRKSNESQSQTHLRQAQNAPLSQSSSSRKKVWRKLSASSAVCHEIRFRRDSLSEQEKDFIVSSKLLISNYLKLFEVATKALESSQSKRLYDVYENLTSRIKVILEDELSVLGPEITKRTTQRRERLRLVGNRSSENLKRLICRQDTSVATLAVASAGLLESLSGLNLGPLSQKTKVQRKEPAEIWSSRRTILARPFQRWKYERTKTDVENSSVPCAAILVDEGRVAVVAEYDNSNLRNNRLLLLDGSNGSPIDSILEGQIQPLGMALTRDQNLVVTDCRGKRVKIISLETKATIAEMGKGMFGWPCGVAVTSKGQIVVSDVFNDCIFIFSSDGKRLKSFGSSGRHQEQLRNPYHLAVDSKDRIYVSDSSNGCVKVFDISGNLLFSSTEIVRHCSVIHDVGGDRKSMNSRKLRDPRGVAVDEFGNFFVADDSSRVSMFDSSGKFSRYLLTEEDSLKYPESLSYCQTRQDGLLLLTEWSPSNLYSVKLFSLYQNM